MSNLEEALGQTQRMLEILHILSGLGISLEGLEEVAEEWGSGMTAAHASWPWIRGRRWKDGWIAFSI